MRKSSLLLILLLLCSSARAQRIFSFSTLEATPIAMAGAVTARLGGLESALYNPATISRYNDGFEPEKLHISFNINPAAAIGYSADFLAGESIPGKSPVAHAGFLLRGITVYRSPFTIGVLLGEEEFDLPSAGSEELFELRGTPERYRSQGFLVFTITPRVKVGGTLSAYIREQGIHAYGASYGVYLEPGPNFNIGVFFAELPDGFSDSRRFLSGVEDQTVNVGISYEPDRLTLLTFDVRNVFKEEGDRTLEARFGAERRLNDWLCLRAGTMPSTQVGDQYYTWGIGLLDRHIMTDKRHYFRVPQFMLNYAMVQKRTDKVWETIHLLSLTMEIG